MSRREELTKIFEGLDKNVLTIVSPMIEDLIFVEEQLTTLKQYPFIKIHPDYPDIQKATPAGKMYKDFLAQEKDIVRVLCSLLQKGKDDGEGESPLREWAKKYGMEFR